MPLDVRSQFAGSGERWPQVWWPKRGKRYLACVLGPPAWVGVHFVPGRPMRPCLMDECPPELHARPVNLKGYCAALLATNAYEGFWRWDPVTLEIYGEDCRQLPFGRPWERLLLQLARGEAVHAPLRITPYRQKPQGTVEPPAVAAWDVLPILCRMWGLNGSARPKAPRILEFRDGGDVRGAL